MRLAFLGTGSAFSVERYNGAVVVDGRILLDGGAPLLPHMHRLGIDPGAVQLLFLTHFHGDHMLGLPPFALHTPPPARGPPSGWGAPPASRRCWSSCSCWPGARSGRRSSDPASRCAT